MSNASNLEYLLADGHGGFLCGTVDGRLTRRWHGWWIARKPPRERVRALAAIEQFVIWQGRHYPLNNSSVAQTIGGLIAHPPSINPSQITFGYYLPADKAANEVTLSISLVLPFRPSIKVQDRNMALAGPDVTLSCNIPTEFCITGNMEEFEAELELEKDCETKWTETHFRTPRVEILLSSTNPKFNITLAVKNSSDSVSVPAALATEARSPLHAAADAFIATTASGRKTILAGYPWFTDWGRDAMIALPGLCISTHRYDVAAEIIDHFLEHANQGIIPNLFPEYGEQPMYNTIDATLWLFEAAFRLHRATGNQSIDSARYEKLRTIIEWHLRGTHNNIRVDDDGLLAGGSPGSQLTWMDVKVDGHVPTPRHGKAVEIQGLWYNALLLMAEEAERLNDQQFAADCVARAERCAHSFEKRFFDSAHSHAADVVDRNTPDSADFTLRPNMIIPFALQHNIIPPARRAGCLRAAAEKLLTPRGLRSLSPDDPSYKPIYRGDVKIRDRAYHQGTVWMWLIMPYLKGIHAERRQVPELFAAGPAIVQGLMHHFEHEGCLHQCNEIFDGDAPHTPRGCFAQAWSVAALIESMELKWE